MKNLMKLTIALMLVIFVAGSSKAQEKKEVHENKEGKEKPVWNEMKAYHEVMSKTFHPAEEGNLQPIKTRSAELASKATLWMNSTPPAEYNKKGVKEKLALLNTESAQLDQAIQSKRNDADILKALTALHDRFHQIVGECEKEEEAPKAVDTVNPDSKN